MTPISGFRSNINQVGFFKEDDLVVRKVKDLENGVSCLVAYISTPGTAPAIDCYKSASAAVTSSPVAAMSGKETSRCIASPTRTATRPA